LAGIYAAKKLLPLAGSRFSKAPPSPSAVASWSLRTPFLVRQAVEVSAAAALPPKTEVASGVSYETKTSSYLAR
jgi:hypothetical protein